MIAANDSAAHAEAGLNQLVNNKSTKEAQTSKVATIAGSSSDRYA
jgi:hypothetical protein